MTPPSVSARANAGAGAFARAPEDRSQFLLAQCGQEPVLSRAEFRARALLDQGEEPVEVEGRLQDVGDPVEPGLPGGGEADAGHLGQGGAGGPPQDGGPEAVGLEQAVEGGGRAPAVAAPAQAACRRRRRSHGARAGAASPARCGSGSPPPARRRPAPSTATPVGPVEDLVRPRTRSAAAASPARRPRRAGPRRRRGRRSSPPPSGPRRRSPTTAAPLASTAAARPEARNQSRSARVLFDPGSTTRSGRPRAAADRTQRTATAGSSRSGSRSPKLATWGKRTTATSTTERGRPRCPTRSRASESSASRSVPAHHRHHAEGGDAGPALELVGGVAQQRRIAAEPVDHEPPHPRAQVVGQQRDGPEQRGEHPAAVDVAHDHRRQPGRRRQRHVGQVAAPAG